MFYVAARQHPAPAPHPAPRAGRLALRRGAVRRRGLHRPQLVLLYHVTPPTRTHKIEPVRRVELEAADDGLHRHRLIEDRRGSSRAATRSPAASRSIFNNDVVFGVVRPAEADAGRRLLPQRRSRTRCSTSTRARACCDTIFGPLRYGPGDYLVLPIGTTWRLDPDEGSRAADPLPRGAVGDRAAEALPERLRPAPRALPVLAARPPRCPTTSPAARRRRATSSSTSDRATGSPPTTTATTRSTSSAGTATSGRSAFNIGDFQPITGRVHQPPPVHQTFAGPELRRLLVRAPQVRLPPARDPGAVQPLEHQQRRGHLLRRGQLHEPARRGDLVVHAPPGGNPPRPAPGHGRGVDRQGSDRGAGGHGRHVPPAQGHPGQAMDLDDDRYPYTWLPSDDHAREASRARGARPGGVP